MICITPTIVVLYILSAGKLISVEGHPQLLKVKLLCAVMDLPAKAALLNCIQYNGAFGCSTCKHPGSTVYNVINVYTFKSVNCFLRCQLEEGKYMRTSLTITVSQEIISKMLRKHWIAPQYFKNNLAICTYTLGCGWC